MSTAMQTAPKQTAIVRADEKSVLPVSDLRKLLTAKLDLVRDALPVAMRESAPRYAIALVGMVQKDEKLAKCTAFSLLSGMLKAANHGLELGPPLNHCYLIPRWSKAVGAVEASFQLGYPGIAALVKRHPDVASITWNVVRKNDEFEEIGGSSPQLVHKAARGDRGEVEAYYAVVKLKNGESIHKVMTAAECDEHRKKFSEFGKNKDGSRAGTWATNFDAMALKTCLLQVCKIAPKSVEFPDFRRIEEQPPPAVEQVTAIVKNAEAPKQLESGKEHEPATVAELEQLCGIVAGEQGREACDVEFEVCQGQGDFQAFGQLNDVGRAAAYRVLEDLVQG